MRKLVFFIIILSVIGPLRGQTSYDVEYAQVCLIDSIAPDTVVQFWRFTQANNPGEYAVDMTFDLGSSYTVEGTVLPCCSCLTEATAMIGGTTGGGIGDIAQSNPAPINALFLLSGAVLLALIIPRRKIAVLLILAAPAAATAQPGTTYDIEHTCICLVDSIASDTVIQFWRFTQSNNPGEYTVDVTFDMGSSYTVAGTVLSCKDYYLGDNPGGSGTLNTLAMWTGTSSLGNSSVTQSGTIISSSLTGSFRVPTGTNAQEPIWAAGMIRYDTDDAAFEGYQGSEFFFAEAATNNLTSGSVLFSDANGRVTQDNSNFRYASDILYTGTASLFAIRFAVTPSNGSVQIGSSSTIAGGSVDIMGNTNGVQGAVAINGTVTGNESACILCSDATYATVSLGKAARATNRNIAIGFNARASGNSSLAIGEDSYADESGSIVFGSPGNIKSNMYLGTGRIQGVGSSGGNSNGAGGNFTINGSGAFGTNFAGGNLTIAGGKGTGTGSPGYFSISNSSPLSSGSTLQSLSERARFVQDSVYFYKYGEGTITDTPAYFAAWNSSGKFIERTAANIVSDLGIASGAISTSTDGSGDIVVAHGMGATPTSVQVTVTGTTPYVVTVHTIGATNFTVRFFDMAGAAVASTAVTATWLAKT